MLHADFLHQSGFTGSTMQIAIIDAGFRNTNTHTAFDSLRAKNQIIGTWNFTDNTSFVYDYSNHGTSVLSCIGANVPDTMIGMAPDAKFYLLKTEEEATEYIVEEYNWAAAAEYADSAGADIINSSLGYTEYDAASQSYTYADMNGSTAPITIAADIAVDKGVLVVNSAGNSGSDAWFYIGAPADGKNVLSVGAVDPTKLIAGFSSNGPTSDGRTKPDVVAQGGPAWIAKANTGSFGFGSGTSFSGPIIAGFSACAFELFKIQYPGANPLQFKAWMKEHADNSLNPNNQYGWGLPNGRKLYDVLGINNLNKSKITLYPNPVKDFCQFNLDKTQKANITIYSSTGSKMQQLDLYSENGNFKLETANFNPTFNVDRKSGVINFDSSMSGLSCILEYVSDGMEQGDNSLITVNKLFEAYIYAAIEYEILSSKFGVQEYIIARSRKKRKALLSNAKIRISNIHPGRLLMNMRGMDKQIK